MKTSREHLQAIQRAKVGLIGLAVVVLLIGFASAVMHSASREAPVRAVGAPKVDVVANITNMSNEPEVGEPLAELGVSPSAANVQAPAVPPSR